MDIINAIILGIIEGLTEFIPVSSTGHLILAGELLGFHNDGKVFEIAIQLGAILAVCWKYKEKLWDIAVYLPRHSEREAEESQSDLSEQSSFEMTKRARQFVLNIVIAFLPAAVIGVLAHSYIKEVLFDPLVVSVALIVGGVIILWIENLNLKPKIRETEEMPWATALKIGFFQTLAMIPGVSRSGATIMGSLLMGVERRAATEFSFFLAIPTMLGATIYDMYKNWHFLNSDSLLIIAIGFITAFLAALMVVSKVVDFISTHGFKSFAYYRIAIGLVMLLLFLG